MTDEQRAWVAQLRCYLDVLQGDPGDEAMLGVQIREVRAVFAALDAARAREQALAETFNERVNWIQVVEARWRSAEAREAKLREKAQVVCNFTGDDGSTEYFVEWLRAMNDLRAALTEGVIVS